MCKVITITNQKGGTGKTTTSLFLAYGLAERGKHVLVVDLDQQADTTFSLTHGKDYSASGKTTYEMLTQQKQAQDCIVQINLGSPLHIPTHLSIILFRKFLFE